MIVCSSTELLITHIQCCPFFTLQRHMSCTEANSRCLVSCLTTVTFPTGNSAAGTLLTSLAAESKVRHPSFGNDTACQSKGVANSYDARNASLTVKQLVVKLEVLRKLLSQSAAEKQQECWPLQSALPPPQKALKCLLLFWLRFQQTACYSCRCQAAAHAQN